MIQVSCKCFSHQVPTETVVLSFKPPFLISLLNVIHVFLYKTETHTAPPASRFGNIHLYKTSETRSRVSEIGDAKLTPGAVQMR